LNNGGTIIQTAPTNPSKMPSPRMNEAFRADFTPRLDSEIQKSVKTEKKHSPNMSEV
jgi:hypothetical protein